MNRPPEIIINSESEEDALSQVRHVLEVALGGPRSRLQQGGQLPDAWKLSPLWDEARWLKRLATTSPYRARDVIVDAVREVFGGDDLHLRIPLSWFDALKRPYRGKRQTDHVAVLVLAYIVMRYRIRERIDPPGLLHLHPEVDRRLGITKERRTGALHFLEKEGYVQRVVIRGIIPWWDPGKRRAGSYLFVLPQPAALLKLASGRHPGTASRACQDA